LGSQFIDQLDVRKAALSVMKDLAEKTAETINLNIVRERRRVCIEKIESKHDIRHFVELGRPVPLYAGASGKVLLAHLDQAEIAAIIAEGLLPLTPHTVVSVVKLQQELAEIRQRGYATSADERVVGAASVSAPIRDAAAHVVAGLTISGPSYRFPHDSVGRFIDLVVAGAADISFALGAPKNAKARG
jgi:DNA-binding IclR family transcriptional regulator